MSRPSRRMSAPPLAIYSSRMDSRGDRSFSFGPYMGWCLLAVLVVVLPAIEWPKAGLRLARRPVATKVERRVAAPVADAKPVSPQPSESPEPEDTATPAFAVAEVVAPAPVRLGPPMPAASERLAAVAPSPARESRVAPAPEPAPREAPVAKASAPPAAHREARVATAFAADRGHRDARVAKASVAKRVHRDTRLAAARPARKHAVAPHAVRAQDSTRRDATPAPPRRSTAVAPALGHHPHGRFL